MQSVKNVHFILTYTNKYNIDVNVLWLIADKTPRLERMVWWSMLDRHTRSDNRVRMEGLLCNISLSVQGRASFCYISSIVYVSISLPILRRIEIKPFSSPKNGRFHLTQLSCKGGRHQLGSEALMSSHRFMGFLSQGKNVARFAGP